jgi:hypothetical protein
MIRNFEAARRLFEWRALRLRHQPASSGAEKRRIVSTVQTA